MTDKEKELYLALKHSLEWAEKWIYNSWEGEWPTDEDWDEWYDLCDLLPKEFRIEK